MSHGTSESGPPDRRLLVGCLAPSSVVVSRTENAWSAALPKPSRSTPLTTRTVTATTRIQPQRGGCASPDPAVEVVRGPAVETPKAPAEKDEEAEDDRCGEGSGDGERHAVLRHAHERADLALPVLPQSEGDAEEHDGADDEHAPGPGTWRARPAVCEGPPDRSGEHAQ